MTNQIVSAKIEQFKAVLNQQTIRAQIKNSLKEHSGAFMSSMIDLYSGESSLQNCDPEKVAMECVKAAALGLPISKSLGFAYVVPFKGNPTFIIGYKGLIQLAQRSGLYRTINADAVYEGELEGVDKMSGEIKLTGERTSSEIVGFFAYFRLMNGFEKVFYMTVEEVTDWAKRYSPGFSKEFSVWKTEFDKMAKKTVLKRLISVYGPMSIEMQNVMENDEAPEEKLSRETAANANQETIEIGADAVKDKTESEAPKPEF
ncbi:MAG TPA: recombinase RecT [Candidatus Omnitrophota bacterium]|nr:recombinase RecT [Candidatus Omnitrophota bacterium]